MSMCNAAPNEGGRFSNGALSVFRPGSRTGLDADMADTLARLEVYGRAQLTLERAAAFFRVSRQTLWRFMTNYPEAAEAWDRGLALGQGDLQAKQMQMALAGNVVMLVWLGKQYLGQRDKMDVQASVISHEDELDQLE